MKRAFVLFALLALALAVDDATMEKVIRSGGPGFAAAMQQDASERLCTEFPNGLPADRTGPFIEAERAKVTYPEALAGDWQRGREVFTTPAKGNCYACHAGEPEEAAFGDVGPPLTNYGLRGQSEGIVRYTYEKIYNSWITVPCSTMPRYGVNARLTPQEIADLVAYLTSPDSPINPAVKGGN